MHCGAASSDFHFQESGSWARKNEETAEREMGDGKRETQVEPSTNSWSNWSPNPPTRGHHRLPQAQAANFYNRENPPPQLHHSHRSQHLHTIVIYIPHLATLEYHVKKSTSGPTISAQHQSIIQRVIASPIATLHSLTRCSLDHAALIPDT